MHDHNKVNYNKDDTCYRNGVNETEALVRLCEGNPYMVAESLAHDSDE